MFAITAVTLLVTAGIGFYARFLVALCREARLFQTCYLVRLETGLEELQGIEQPEAEDSLSRAA